MIRARKQPTISQTYILSRRLFLVLALLFVFAIGAYIFFIESAIVHVVSRKNIESEIRSMRTSLLTLESSYYAAQAKLTQNDALALGMGVVSEKDTQFIALDESGKVLTYRGR